MSVRALRSRAVWMAPLLACFLAACGGAPPVDLGNRNDAGSNGPSTPAQDSGTTLPGDAGSGSDGGSGSGSDGGSGSGSDGGSGSGSDGGSSTSPDGGGLTDGGMVGDGGTATDGGSPTALVIDAGPDATLCAGSSARIGPSPQPGLEYSWSPAAGLSSATEAQPMAAPSATTAYVLTVRETATGRTGSDTVVLTVNELPVANAGVDHTIAQGSSVQLGAPATGGTAPYTYAWSATPTCDTGSCLRSASSAQPEVLPAESTLFTVVVTDAASCSSTDTVQVTVVPPLVAEAGGDKSLCAGQSTSIGLPASGGQAPYTYAWSMSPACTGCLSSTTEASPTASPLVTTTFTQMVTDALAQTASASSVVTVHPNPGTAGASVDIDPGASVVIGPTAVSGATYAWSCNRADCALSSTDMAQPVAGPTRTTTYTLDASNGPGCQTRSTLTLSVNLMATTVPQDGELAFPLSSSLLVQFNQPVKPATLNSTTVQLQDAVTGAPVAANLSYNAANWQLSVTPTGTNYVASGDYTLELMGGPNGIASDDPIQPNLFPTDLQVDFTTAAADTTPPTLTFRNPIAGATGVANNTTVVAAFSEAVNAATVTGTTFTLTGGGQVAGTVRYDANNRTATFTPSAPLAFSTLYTVSLTNIRDLSGNALTTSWTFTTGTVADTTPPTVTAVSPVNGASAVASSDPILVTFSENVDPATLTGLRLRLVSNGTSVAGSVSYNSTTRVATFTPAVLLGSLSTYEVYVSGVRDMAGNAMAAPFTSRFTTRQTLFSDNFENGLSAWSLPAPTTGAPWSLTTTSFHSSRNSLTESASGKYANNLQSVAELAAPLNVSGLSSVTLQFWMRTRTERNRDFVYMDASVDGGAWTQITGGRFSGNLSWAVRSLQIPLTNKSQLRIRFRFESNATKQSDGVYIDDVIIQAP